MTNFLQDFASSFLETIFYIIGSLINLILLPINLLFSAFIPNFDNIINSFNQFIIFFVSTPLNFFLHLIPPLTRGIIIFYLGLIVAYYSFLFAYRGIVLIPTIIRKIKFW